jgi:hypothetical protein
VKGSQISCRPELRKKEKSPAKKEQSTTNNVSANKESLKAKGKVKQSRYTPWRRLGGEELYLLLIHDLGTR